MTLLQPVWLWLLILIPVVWLIPRPTRDPLHAALRSLVIALLALGLARPVRTTRDGTPVHVLILDQSTSVSDSAVKARRTGVRRQRPPRA